MVIRSDIFPFWQQLQEQLPPGFDLEKSARARGAFTRARGVRDVASLLRLAMAYGVCGMSLRETCAWAAVTGVAELKDPSLLDRLCKAAPWLADIVAGLIAHRASAMPSKRWAGYRLRALDATALCQPGADRTTWRLHVGYDLAGRQVDAIELTDAAGGEHLQRLKYRPGEIVLADRGYARARNLRLVKQEGADFIVRAGWASLRLKQADGRPFDLFATLRAQNEQQGEVTVLLDQDPSVSEPLQLRLVIWRKPPEQAHAEKKRLLKNAKKRGTKVDARSLEAAEYVMLVTSLPAATFAAADVLALYRFRWQIELAFKRMKSLAGLDELAARKPELAQAWIYARLIAFLIAERNAGQVPESSPSGTGCEAKSHPKRFTLAPQQNGPDRPPRRHSWSADMATHHQPLPANAQIPA